MIKLHFVTLGQLLGILLVSAVSAELVITDLGKEYDFDPAVSRPGLYYHITKNADVCAGNTSLRNVDKKSLIWKGKPNANGHGYFQRNRDLGQVFNVPAGEDVKLDALVLRTSRGAKAVMQGSPGAPITVQFFEVLPTEGDEIRINENGTTKGDRATHGFDHSFNRADDYIEGVEYRPIARATGGIFPDIEPTYVDVQLSPTGEFLGEQSGHLRYVRFDLTGEDELLLKGGRRYALLVGFESPGELRGIGLANSWNVYLKEPAEFIRDPNGKMWWGIRREGNGVLPPTMIGGIEPPSEPKLLNQLIAESMFPKHHWENIPPTSNGFPDVDTYRTLQFYLEVKE